VLLGGGLEGSDVESQRMRNGLLTPFDLQENLPKPKEAPVVVVPQPQEESKQVVVAA
jgi:hypothetical protein